MDLGSDVELVDEADLLDKLLALVGGEMELHLVEESGGFQGARRFRHSNFLYLILGLGLESKVIRV